MTQKILSQLSKLTSGQATELKTLWVDKLAELRSLGTVGRRISEREDEFLAELEVNDGRGLPASESDLTTLESLGRFIIKESAK